MSRQLVLAVVGLALVATAAFVVTYRLRESDAVGIAQQPPQPPDPFATPIPGVMPDTSLANWHIPYVNQERDKPKFTGVLNGISVDPDWKGRTGFDVCPEVGLAPVAPGILLDTVAAPGPLQIDPGSMPPGITPVQQPHAFACRGILAEVTWQFHVEAGTPHANPGGGAVIIRRVHGNIPVAHSASTDRWETATIGGQSAVVVKPIVEVGEKQFGECVAAWYDPKTDVFSTITGVAANAEFCIAVAEAVAS